MIQLLHGDCLKRMKELLDNSIDSIVTDPPYGLAFMGKKWDYDVPSVEIWKECLRVLKPGGHLLSFGGTRTYHRMTVNIEDAGFEIRDQIQWIYGSGFPKSHNLKNEWQGWGTALKPANEPICVARKPLEKGLTIAENVLKYGTGAINVDESRVAVSAEDQATLDAAVKRMTGNAPNSGAFQSSAQIKPNPAQGRWPANIIFDEQAAEMLDQQSGDKIRGASFERTGTQPEFSFTVGKKHKPQSGHTVYANSYGGASRFFYVTKSSKRERNAGLEGMPLVESGIKNDSGRGFSESDPHKKILNQNHHPTVKPIKLMEYLIKLVTPPSGIVLDPFMGSGSTGVAAKSLGFEFVGCEMNDDYFEIAKKRIENQSSQLEIYGIKQT